MNDLFLTEGELRTLTDRERPTYQRKALKRMGLDYYVSADGRVKVLRADVERVQGNTEQQPDFAAVTGGAA